MRPTTVRDLLLGLGLTAGLGVSVNACSSQNTHASHPDNGNGGGGGTGGVMGNGPGGFMGGTGGVMGNGLGGIDFGAGGNAVRGGAPGHLDALDDATSDSGKADAGDPIDVGSADTSEDAG